MIELWLNKISICSRERFFWYAIILCSGVWPTSMKSNEATTPSRANKGSSPVKVGIYINIIVLEFFSWSTNMHIMYMYIAICVFFVQIIVLQKCQTISVYIYSLCCKSSWSVISCFKALFLLKELHCVQNENSNYGQLSYFKSIEAWLWWFLWYTLKYYINLRLKDIECRLSSQLCCILVSQLSISLKENDNFIIVSSKHENNYSVYAMLHAY